MTVLTDWQFAINGNVLFDPTRTNPMSTADRMFVQNPEQLFDTNVRTADQPRANSHGETPGLDLLSSRQIILKIFIQGKANSTLRTQIETFKRWFAPSKTPVPLEFKMPGQGQQIVYGRPRKSQLDLTNAGVGVVIATQEFICQDPRIYDDNTQVLLADLAASRTNTYLTIPAGGITIPAGGLRLSATGVLTGNTFAFTPGGTFSPTPLLALYGPMIHPTVEIIETGDVIAYGDDLIAGDILRIDFDARTCVLDNSGVFVNRRTFLGATPPWPTFTPGNTYTFRLEAGAYDPGSPKMELDWQDAYI